MAIGPVQLLVFGFDQPRFSGRIAAELSRLRRSDVVRVIDAVVVRKDAGGNVASVGVSDLTPEEAKEFGAVVGSLVGLGAAGAEGMEVGAEVGAAEVAARGGHVFDQAEMSGVLQDIPRDSAAAIMLLEHRWAIPLREAIMGEGGVPIWDAWLLPRHLIALGLVAAAEA